jgi:hypothetical protein
MMELDKLNSRRVFHYFRAISSIPHGSGNTKALSDWCLRFAKSRSLDAYIARMVHANRETWCMHSGKMVQPDRGHGANQAD